MSHRRTHIKNKISRSTPKTPFFKKSVFWIVFLCLAITFGAVYFVLFFENFWVKNIMISGNEKISTESIKELVVTGINKNITKSIFLINEGDIVKKIMEKFPAIEKISISKKYFQTITLGITERKPAGAYCNENGKCFLVDQNGVAFSALGGPRSAEEEGMFIIRQNFGKKDVVTGEQAIEGKIISAVSKIQKSLKEKFNIDVLNAMVTTPIRLDVKTKENWEIYFNIEDLSNIDFQVDKLGALLSSELTPDQRKTLEYIDLRFEKTYYK